MCGVWRVACVWLGTCCHRQHGTASRTSRTMALTSVRVANFGAFLARSCTVTIFWGRSYSNSRIWLWRRRDSAVATCDFRSCRPARPSFVRPMPADLVNLPPRYMAPHHTTCTTPPRDTTQRMAPYCMHQPNPYQGTAHIPLCQTQTENPTLSVHAPLAFDTCGGGGNLPCLTHPTTPSHHTPHPPPP